MNLGGRGALLWAGTLPLGLLAVSLLILLVPAPDSRPEPDPAPSPAAPPRVAPVSAPFFPANAGERPPEVVPLVRGSEPPGIRPPAVSASAGAGGAEQGRSLVAPRMPETPGQRAPDAPQAPDVRAAQPAAEVPVARLRVRGPPALEEVENRRAADMLGQWIATYGATILTWMKDADIDDATYDRAILSAVQRMSYAKGPEAAALFTAFVTAGRMDRMTDAGLYAHAVSAAKGLGAVFGAMDYPAALEWGFALPEGSAAQAYVLSNVAFSQSHGAALPSLPWIKDMHPGFARVRVIAALAYGRMLAARDTVLTPEIKRQLDSDEFIPARLSEIVRESALPAEEKRVLLALL